MGIRIWRPRFGTNRGREEWEVDGRRSKARPEARGLANPSPRLNPFTHLCRLSRHAPHLQKMVQNALWLVPSWVLKGKWSRSELHVPSAFFHSSRSQAWLCLRITWYFSYFIFKNF